MAARSQLAQPRGLLPSNGTTPASSPAIESRAAMDGLDELSAEEHRVLQQQQSLEMVKIMLHVSVSFPNFPVAPQTNWFNM